MEKFADHPSYRQQGAASLAIALLILLILASAIGVSMKMSGSSTIDSSDNEAQVAALYLAESGLERAMSILKKSAYASSSSSESCTDLVNQGPFTLGRGQFRYVSAEFSPPSCATGLCCVVRVEGTVGSSSRMLERRVNMTLDNGVAGFSGYYTCSTCTDDTPIEVTTYNPYNVYAIGLFNLGWRRNIPGVTNGNVSADYCDGCTLLWNIESSTGEPSIGSMGDTTPDIPPFGSVSIIQGLESNSHFAEVGIFIASPPGVTHSPRLIANASYWDDASTPKSKSTTNDSKHKPSVGETNSGVATSIGLCTTPDVNITGTRQLCNNWCYGGNTLIFGVSGSQATVADNVTSVNFNSNGVPLQNIPMSRIVHFPNMDGTTPGATGDIFSEFWYAYNPDYLSDITASSGGQAFVTAGITTFLGLTTKNSTILTVSAPSDNLLAVGDVISGFPGGSVTITETHAENPARTGTGGAGTYTVSRKANAAIILPMQAARNSAILNASLVTNGYLSVGDTITGTGVATGTTITSVPAGCSNPTTCNIAGAYGISIAQSFSTTLITANGYTIHMTGASAPEKNTLLAVFNPIAGQLAARACAASAPDVPADPSSNLLYLREYDFNTKTCTGNYVTPAASSRLVSAQICGGTCAFFNNPSSIISKTQFSLISTSGVEGWAGGFVCLSGVDPSKLGPIPKATATPSTWHEPVK